jgi:hypothetical protein
VSTLCRHFSTEATVAREAVPLRLGCPERRGVTSRPTPPWSKGKDIIKVEHAGLAFGGLLEQVAQHQLGGLVVGDHPATVAALPADGQLSPVRDVLRFGRTGTGVLVGGRQFQA